MRLSTIQSGGYAWPSQGPGKGGRTPGKTCTAGLEIARGETNTHRSNKYLVNPGITKKKKKRSVFSEED